MTSLSVKTSPQKTARTAGLLYLMIAILGGYSMGYLPTIIVASGDAVKTADNLLANQGLFRLGVLFDIVVLFSEIILTSILFRMFESVSKTLSMAAALARLSMIGVMGVNLVNYMIAITLLSGADFLNVFGPEQLQALALLFLEAHGFAVYVWGLFFGLHLLLLGYLVFLSGYFPKILGLLLMVGSFGYVVEAFGVFVLPENTVVSTIAMGLLGVVIVGELSFALWLLIKGLNFEKWQEWNTQSIAA